MTIIAQYESVDIILEVRFSRDYGLFLNFNLFSLSLSSERNVTIEIINNIYIL